MFCFHKNIHKTCDDVGESDATDNLSQEPKCIVDIDIILSFIRNVIWNAYTVNRIEITNPINIFNFRDN